MLDVFENNGPEFFMDSNISVSENEIFIAELNASDPDGEELTFSILTEMMPNVFDVNESTGELLFGFPPSFEHPDDKNLDNIYEVTLGVSDGHETDYLNLRVHVFDVRHENQAPVIQLNANGWR